MSGKESCETGVSSLVILNFRISACIFLRKLLTYFAYSRFDLYLRTSSVSQVKDLYQALIRPSR